MASHINRTPDLSTKQDIDQVVLGIKLGPVHVACRQGHDMFRVMHKAAITEPN